MAIQIQNLEESYLGDGTTIHFPFYFKVIENTAYDQVVVTVNGNVSGDYLLDILDPNDGGNVVFFNPPNVNDVVIIRRHTPLTRITDFTNGGIIDADLLDSDLDYITSILQEIDKFSLVTNSLGKWDALNKNIINLANPINPYDATNKWYVDNTALIYNPGLLGWDARNYRINNLASPTQLHQAATKQYVDQVSTQLGNLPPPSNPTDNGKWLFADNGVASWEVIDSNQIKTYLGYTPANKAGDTFTGPVIHSNTLTVNGVSTINNEITFNNNTILKGEVIGDPTNSNTINAENSNLNISDVTIGNVLSLNYTINQPLTDVNSLALNANTVLGIPRLMETITYTDSFSVSRPLGTSLIYSQPAIFQPIAGLTASNNIGFQFTATGTTTARTLSGGFVKSTNLRRQGYVTATTAGLICSHYWTTAQWSIRGGFYFSFYVVPSSTNALIAGRDFYGLSTSVAAATNVEPSTILNCIGLAKLSTSNTLHLVYGGTVAQTPILLPGFVANPVSSEYLYRVQMYCFEDLGGTLHAKIAVEKWWADDTNSEVLYFHLSGNSTQLPGPDLFLAPRFWRTNNTNTGAVAFDLGTVVVEQLPY